MVRVKSRVRSSVRAHVLRRFYSLRYFSSVSLRSQSLNMRIKAPRSVIERRSYINRYLPTLRLFLCVSMDSETLFKLSSFATESKSLRESIFAKDRKYKESLYI